VHCFDSFEEYEKSNDKCEAFIVSESDFAVYVDYFIPRRGRTIVVSSSAERRNIGSSVSVVSYDSDPKEIAEKIAEILKSPEKNDENGELSQREREVLREVASGKTNKEIADLLCISVNTVITHRKNISSKLGIKSVSGLSLYALMNGIIL